VNPSDLTWVLFVLTGLSWGSFAVLGHAAVQRPRIGALTERTTIAAIIALLGTVSCLIVTNTDAGRPLFDAATASLLFRLSILGVLSVPTAWLVLWFSGRLGQGGNG
jgi:hypothetical protein